MKLLLKTHDLWIEKEDKLILKDINLEVFEGEFIWLSGETGSGKSLLLETLSLQKNPTRGGMACGEKYPLCTPFDILMEEETVKKNLLTAVRDELSYDITYDISEILKTVQLFDKRNEKVSNLSTGEKQMLNLSTFLILNSDLTLFDEPFAFLDEKRKNIFIKECANKTSLKKSILIATTTKKPASFPPKARELFIKDGQIYEY